MLQQEKKNNCPAVIVMIVLLTIALFAFPPLFILFLVLLFTWKISFKKIVSYLQQACSWSMKDKMENYENLMNKIKFENKSNNSPSHISRNQEIKKEEKINKENLYDSKREYKNKKRELKYERSSFKSGLILWWQKQKSIWDDYESVLDKFKK